MRDKNDRCQRCGDLDIPYGHNWAPGKCCTGLTDNVAKKVKKAELKKPLSFNERYELISKLMKEKK